MKVGVNRFIPPADDSPDFVGDVADDEGGLGEPSEPIGDVLGDAEDVSRSGRRHGAHCVFLLSRSTGPRSARYFSESTCANSAKAVLLSWRTKFAHTVSS